MTMEFGVDKEFLPLYAQWFYFEQDDFFLEVFPFQNITKGKLKDPNFSFNLGKFNRSEPFMWIFNDGDSCGSWGSKSSVEVHLHCSLINKIFSFREVASCYHILDFGSPCSCVDEYKRRIELMDDITLDEWAREAGLV